MRSDGWLSASRKGFEMRKSLDLLAKIILVSLLIAIFAGGIYGLAKLGKTLSYKWWYQDMVQQTVRDMVKDSALK